MQIFKRIAAQMSNLSENGGKKLCGLHTSINAVHRFSAVSKDKAKVKSIV
jgi:hypothetical protein